MAAVVAVAAVVVVIVVARFYSGNLYSENRGPNTGCTT